jgi:uncharacterized phage protein (TIGR02218 family)
MTDLTTTRARAWRLVRGDGLMLGFTDHDRDLAFDGTVFRAATGMTAKAFSQATGLAVDNTEAAGALSDGGLSEVDITAGRWDGAGLTIWEVDWADVAARRVLFRGSLGEITRQGGAFRAELRGLTEALQQVSGRVFGTMCPAVLGDVRCRFDLTAPGYSAEVVLEAIEPGGAALLVTDPSGLATGWFAEGPVRMLDGRAAGLSAVVRTDRVQAGGLRRLALWAALGVLPDPGDRMRLEAGCDKRFATCRQKFANQANFQGFPHLPGEDWLFLMPRPGASGGRRNGAL